MKDQVRAWTREISQQQRVIDRQIRDVEREREKFVREAKAAARKGDTFIVKAIAKNYAMAGKMIDKLTTTKATLNSVKMTLETQFAVQRVAGVMGKSTAIMGAMRHLMNAPEISATMRKMGEEMQRAGIVEDMMMDAMDAAEPAGLDAEADEVTEAIMHEITGGILGKAAVGTAAVPTAAATAVAGGAAARPAAPRRVAVAEGADGGGAATGGAGTGGDGATVDAELAALQARLGKL